MTIRNSLQPTVSPTLPSSRETSSSARLRARAAQAWNSLVDDSIDQRARRRPVATEPPCRRLGPWRLGRVLGAGATASVFEASRAGDERPVALKVFHESTTDRLAGEVDAHRRLRSHPRIAELLDSGQTRLEDGRLVHWLAYELVEGGTLRDALRARGALGEEATLRVSREIAEALEAIHDACLVHRDLKTENVLIGPDGVKVADLGLARRERGGAGAARLTEDGGFVGTVAYSSPEQITGRDVGPKTDVWALGLMIVEMLAGRNPYVRSNPFATASAIGQGLDASRELSGSWGRIVDAATEPSAVKRASARTIARELERFAKPRNLRGVAKNFLMGAMLVAWMPINAGLRGDVGIAMLGLFSVLLFGFMRVLAHGDR